MGVGEWTASPECFLINKLMAAFLGVLSSYSLLLVILLTRIAPGPLLGRDIQEVIKLNLR